MAEIQHLLCINNRKNLEISNVLDVCGFTDREIKLKLKDGTILQITGVNLRITDFQSETGKFTLIGLIDMVKYRSKNEPILKRIIK